MTGGARRGGMAGFALLEALAALFVLALALGVLLPQVGGAVQMRGLADGTEAAAAVAETVLDQLGTGLPLAEGDLAGRQDDYRWTLMVRQADERVAGGRRLSLFRVEVSVAWGSAVARNRHEIGATTYRLADTPAGGAP